MILNVGKDADILIAFLCLKTRLLSTVQELSQCVYGSKFQLKIAHKTWPVRDAVLGTMRNVICYIYACLMSTIVRSYKNMRESFPAYFRFYL